VDRCGDNPLLRSVEGDSGELDQQNYGDGLSDWTR